MKSTKVNFKQTLRAYLYHPSVSNVPPFSHLMNLDKTGERYSMSVLVPIESLY